MEAYVVLFASAFLAATLIPFYSEIALASMVALEYDPLITLAVATLGNTLGATVNWAMGRFLLRYRDRRWFLVDTRHLLRMQAWFQRYGVWSLLFAWLPIGGDALTFIAGMMRVRFAVFFVLTAIGKGLRYAVIVYTLGLFT